MPTDTGLRLYAVVKATPELHSAYSNSDKSTVYTLLTDYTRKLLQEHPYDSFSTQTLIDSFQVIGAPSKDWKAAFVGDDEYPDMDLSKEPPETLIPDELIIIYAFESSSQLRQFISVVHHGRTIDSDAPISGAGVDIGVASADHWCPGTGNLEAFGNRMHARRTVRADALTAAIPPLRGRKVNVVLVDEGLHKGSFAAKNWGGGLDWLPPPPATPIPAGSAERTSHGMMIARTILDLAPDAVLYDVPLIPPRITKGFFLGTSSADAVYRRLLLEIWLRRFFPRWAGPWIFVNAWAIFDRSAEPSLGDYTENKNMTSLYGHPLITAVKWAIRPFDFDVIFAAGNCGEFCASKHCGGLDRGPGHSIWGANALPEVITAGAVLTDEMWAGYSSQGPGPSNNGLAHDKPDFCAPSNFREANDAAVINSGTSTACAMTAGVVAALRSNPSWDQRYVSPAMLHSALTSSARKTQGPYWNGRLGHGILDAAAAMGKLPPA